MGATQGGRIRQPRDARWPAWALRPAFATWLGWLAPHDRPLIVLRGRDQDPGDVFWQAAKVGYDTRYLRKNLRGAPRTPDQAAAVPMGSY